MWNKIKSAFAKIYSMLENKPFAFCACSAIVLNTIVEMLSRRSIFGGLEAFAVHPVMFIYNSFIVSMTLGVCVLFRRRIFIFTFVALIWLACGITNCVLLGFRTTPFSAVDLQILSSVIGIINIYLNGFELFLIVAAILLALTGLTVLFIKTPRTKGQMHYIKTCSILGVCFVSAFAFNSGAIAAESDSSNFPNIADAYEDYGFVYCFSNSILDTGIDKPDDYSPETMNYVAAEVGNDRGEHAPEVMPNVVLVQLESFFDVNHITDMAFTENPVPNFSALKEKYSSGYLTVPSIGAGTANTEFEILTGMSLDFFGASEYPFKTVLKKVPCESICYNLADYGYTSHAIHNNDGTFYDRHKVYPQLGFNTFTSIEYMLNAEVNPLNWADDSAIVPCVTDALESTEGRDFVFAVSVQPHGRYPSVMPEDAPHDILLTEHAEDMSEEQVTAFEYYINQLHETDAFIGELIEQLEDNSEPTVLVLYGDHLPNLNLTSEQLENGDLLQTEYVIWSNYDMSAENKDLAAFQLTPYVTERLGFGGGYISSYDRNHSDSADYPDRMQDIGYDMLFGEQYAFGGYNSMNMRMGVKDVTISGYEYTENDGDEMLTVYGENLTEWSFISINGNRIDTEFIDNNTLHANHRIELGDEITVILAGSDDEVLSTTNALIVE